MDAAETYLQLFKLAEASAEVQEVKKIAMLLGLCEPSDTTGNVEELTHEEYYAT